MTVNEMIAMLSSLSDEERKLPVVVYSEVDESASVPWQVCIETRDKYSYCKGDHPLHYVKEWDACVVIGSVIDD
jgi:hypothetical protein